MHCDLKKFQCSDDLESHIRLVEITASVYGTTINFSFLPDQKEKVLEALSHAAVPLKSVGPSKISIRTPLHETADIKKGLEALIDCGLINKDFAQEIMTNYPNGHSGTMDLNNPSKGLNALLLIAASSIFELNERLKREEIEVIKDRYGSLFIPK